MTGSSSMECPNCSVAMAQREKHDVTIDYCTDCGGVWLDPGELEAITGEHHSSHKHRDIDIDLEDDDEYVEEEEEEEEGGLLGFVTSAIGGGEEEGEFEEEEEWGEEEFGGEEEF